jgi:hypothetical protein
VRRLLDPEQFGHAVTPEVRDAARTALGREPVERAADITAGEVEILTGQIARLRVIERAAWHALEMARKGHAADAYDALAHALEVKSCTPI